MTRPHDDHAPRSGDGASRRAPLSALELERVDRIAAELAALGEDPADDDELALALAAGSNAHAGANARAGSNDPRTSVEHDDVRTVATLVALSTWTPPATGLLPLEQQRVWQRVAKRVASPAIDPHHHAPAANGAGLRGVLASLALVAGVALVLRVDVEPPPSEEDKAALVSMGQATRAALEATVPGEQDGARARALAEGYAERLRAERGAER